ncbi:hypothetical protein VTK73DRAFT_3753 [Phialemonium thermophilum]|uniref:Uncharacterized protein n=1 Tax=Phialemonium thermophilum TaxID=223376 RepID=A0ABR3VF07_9PEZI
MWSLAGSYRIRSGAQGVEDTWGLSDYAWDGWRWPEGIQGYWKPWVEVMNVTRRGRELSWAQQAGERCSDKRWPRSDSPVSPRAPASEMHDLSLKGASRAPEHVPLTPSLCSSEIVSRTQSTQVPWEAIAVPLLGHDPPTETESLGSLAAIQNGQVARLPGQSSKPRSPPMGMYALTAVAGAGQDAAVFWFTFRHLDREDFVINTSFGHAKRDSDTDEERAAAAAAAQEAQEMQEAQETKGIAEEKKS